jgi:carboxyl-terminal processing protease
MGSAYALSIEPTQEDSILAQMITRELERRHLASDALFAERKPMVGQLILKAIDPSRSLLTQDDIRQADIDRLPDQIERGRLNTVYQLYGLSLTRSEERLDYWLDILNQGVGSIDLSDQEELRIRDEETPWVSDLTSLKDLWRKQLENQAIGLLLADRTEDETYKALIRRYNSQKNRIEQTRPDDIFAGVINAYASAYDPHTSYLPPADSETFNINMSLSLQGIGAVLQSEDEFTKVVSLIPGGPAEMDGRLKPADRILSIAQGSQPFEDVVGWRLDEVVQKIRGPKGSQVRLEVQAGDDVPHREIVLIRDRVQLEEQSAKSQIIEAGKNGEKIGIITIPTFYSDFTAKQAGDPNYRSTTRDVKKLLEELRNQDV